MVSTRGQIRTPIVNLYNIRTDLVASSQRGVTPGIGVVSFKYRYDDENPDECTIKIQSTNTAWLNSLNITINKGDDQVDNKIIRLSWGYQNDMISRRTVVVRDIKSKYGNNVIYTELICSDFTTYLKLTQSPFIEKISPIEYIKQFCTGVVNIVIQANGKLLYKQSIEEKYGQVKKSLDVKVVDNTQLWDYIEESTNQEISGSKTDVTYIEKSESIEVGEWFENDATEVREFLEKERDINVISKSPYSVLKGIMYKAPLGPWYITGRDNTILLHNRNLGQGNLKNYIYGQEPGNLIDFSVETKYENFMKRSISYNNMDPETKKAKFLDSYIKSLVTAQSPKDILKTNMPDEERERKLQKWLDLYQGGYQNLRTLYSKYEVTSQGNIHLVDDYRSYNPNNEKEKLLNPLKTNKYGPSDFVDLSQVVQDGIYYTTPVADEEEELNLVNNAARKLAMEKEEAKIIIEGDIQLRAGYRVGIRGVEKNHVGDYYIKVCEHTISNMGYKVTMETFKVVPDAEVLQYKTDETYETTEEVVDGENKEVIKLSHSEKFDLESKLFRNWRIKVNVAEYIVNTNKSITGTNPFDNVTAVEYLDLNQYLANNPDTKASDIIKLYREGKITFENNTEER